ncbi:hypothetical protein ACWEP8_28445 [Streptomyces hydrogenans]
MNLAIVLTGAVLVGFSRDLATLLTGQILQGALAGFFPLLVGILRDRPGGGDAESRRGISVMVAALVAGLALGLLASGAVATGAGSPTAALWVPALAASVASAVRWPLLRRAPCRCSREVSPSSRPGSWGRARPYDCRTASRDEEAAAHLLGLVAGAALLLPARGADR